MPMKFLSRLVVPMLLCALVTLFVPALAHGTAMKKSSCCAETEMPADAGDECPLHGNAPANQQESPCCHACALGLCLLFVAPPEFVYAPTGEAALVSLSQRSHALPHRPPVPPPRFAIS